MSFPRRNIRFFNFETNLSIKGAAMSKKVEAKYQCLPFWSWNDDLDPELLKEQIEWMSQNGIGGFFMHARGGLTTPYLGEKWFECIEAAGKKAKDLGLEAYAYDENGWPSGFAGGALLKDEANHDQYLSYSYGPFDPKAYVCYDYSTSSLKRVNSGDDCFNVYVHCSGSTADILNKEVVDKFIALTHEEYRKRDDYGLKGFFTDEPQYYRWATSFTRVLPGYFEKTYHQDIKDSLGLLFLEKDGYREFRYRYWLSLQRLMLTNWAQNLFTYCEKNGYTLTGHYVEETSMGYQIMCCGGVMPFYEFEQMPGVDWLGRDIYNELSPKQLGSAAAQLEKKQTIAEMFACCGWDVTPKELKKIAEFLYVNGVNRCCQHLLPYAEHGQRKRDYPAHYSPINPWVKKGFKEFNDYFSSLGKLLSESEDVVNVGLFHPIRSCYFDYKRDEDGFGVASLDQDLRDVIDTLSAYQIPHHFLDETIMESHAKVVGSSLIVGKMKYDYVILPHVLTMGKYSESLLREYCLSGGKILLLYEKPAYLEGKPYDYPYLKSNCTLEDIMAAQPFKADKNPEVMTSLHQDKEGRLFLYAVNKGKATSVTFTLRGYKSFLSYDTMNDTFKPQSLDVSFEEGQSFVLCFSKKPDPKKEEKRPIVHFGETFSLLEPVTNKLTLDSLEFSFDKKKWNGPFYHLGVLDLLLHKRYEGPLYLSYHFKVDELPPSCFAYIETNRLKKVELNGGVLEQTGSHPLEKGLEKFDLLKGLRRGDNNIVVTLDYFQGENVYYALFGENVTESLKNCLVYDSDIEAIFIEGEFGVKGHFERGSADDILLGDSFSVVREPTKISSLIEGGFPFFNGDIALEQEIEVEDPNSILEVDQRFQLIDVKVNGQKAGRMMFSSYLDLSPYLKRGKNRLEVVLTVSNRNLLGPSHTLEQENLSVSPDTFEMAGKWKDGKSELFRGSFSFVKTII